MNPPANRKPVGLVRATSKIMVATVLSGVCGLLREMVVARQFGASKQTDAYFFALSLSLGVGEFVMGGVAAALISVYTFSDKRGKQARESFGNTVINVYVLLLIVVALCFALIAPLAARVLASGLDQGGENLVITLMWSLAPSIALFGMWMILRSLLEAEQSFFVAQLSTGFGALGVVAAVLLLARFLGVFSLPIGIAIGTTIQVVWVAYWLRRAGFQYQLKIDLKSPEFSSFLAVLGPGVLAGVISGTIPIIDRSMASHLPAGSIASLGFAQRPLDLVSRLGLYSLITALLPTLAWRAANKDTEQFRASVAQLLSILIFLTTPLGLILAALHVPLIQVLFQRGHFDAGATAVTSRIFAISILGLTPMAIAVALTTVFKSLQDTKTVAFIGGGSNLVSKVIFNFAFIGPFGVFGLALSSALQHTLSGTLLFRRLSIRLNGLGVRHLALTFAKTLFASLAAFLVVHLVTLSAMPPLVQCGLGVLAGATTFLLLVAHLRMPEFWSIAQFLVGEGGIGQRITIRLNHWWPSLPVIGKRNDDSDH